MTSNTIVTDIGLAKIAAAAAAGTTVKLKYFAIGDASYIPSGRETQLTSEQFRKEIDSSSVDNEYKDTMLLNVVLPANVGGWYIREYGIFDEEGSLIAIGSCDEIYKPSGDNKSKAVTIAFTIAAKFSNIDSVEFNIKLDGYADVKYVNQQDELVKGWVNDQLALKANLKSPAFTDKPTAPTAPKGANTDQLATMAALINALADYTATTSLTELLALKANLKSPAFTDKPTAPTVAKGTNTDQLATMAALVNALADYTATTSLTELLALKANLKSPAFTDKPTAPTALKGTNTDQLATMAALINALADYTATTSLTELLALKANLKSPAFTDKPTAPTAPKGTRSDQLATMAALINALADYTTTTNLQNNSTNIVASYINAINSVSSTGKGDQNGYGFVATTPKGVYAPNGNSDFGNISMRKSTATQGIVYPNTPNAAGPYSMEIGWNGSRVVGRVDNNNSALFTLANYSDVVNAGGNNFLWLTSGTFSGSINIGGTLYAPTGNYVLILSQVFVISNDADSRASFSFNGFGSTTASFGARLNTGSATLQFLCLWGKRGSIPGI